MKYREYYEQKQRGTPDFPIGYYYVDENRPQYEMPLHWNKELEIVRVCSGILELHINNRQYTLTRGDIIVIGCGCLHRATPFDAVYECLLIDLNMLKKQSGDAAAEFITPIIGGKMAINCLLHLNHGLLYSRMASIFEAMRTQPPYFKLSVYSLLYETVYLLYAEGFATVDGKHGTRNYGNAVAEAVDWIDENFQEYITLKVLANRVGLNEKYFCRLFKQVTGHSLIDYVNRVRVENACHLMIYENMSVTEAALHSGFDDMSYFSKVFKRYKSISPKKWKQ